LPAAGCRRVFPSPPVFACCSNALLSTIAPSSRMVRPKAASRSPPQPPPAPRQDAVGDELPHISRIVVYIDDLDRCPPARVVEVLEAVQLLLAVPLFVVVVAVDPRWLLRCLAFHYREILDAPDSDGGDIWGSTPMQYLEKIFQIPFTLPPVDPAGYTSLVDTLTAPLPAADSSASTSVGGHTPTAAAATSPSGTRTGAANLAPGIVLPAVPVVERFDPLSLTDDERRFLALLGPPLVTTPRSIKRLVNSYGLLNALRGSRHQQDLQQINHSATESRAAMALLATLIAFPHLSPTFFTHLRDAAADAQSCSWAEFLKRAKPQQSGQDWTSGLLGPLTGRNARRWQQFVGALEDLAAKATAADLPLPEALDAWTEWAVPVGRLSFETGRSVIGTAEEAADTHRHKDLEPH